MKKIVSVTTLVTKRHVPPKMLRASARVRMLATVAIFGANHMVSTAMKIAKPASARMKFAGVSVKASASVPTISSPIQPGEPRNIRIANRSWQRLTNFRPGRLRKRQYCRLPRHQRRSRRMNSIRFGGFSSQLSCSSGTTRTSIAAAPHQHGLDLVVAEDRGLRRASAAEAARAA